MDEKKATRALRMADAALEHAERALSEYASKTAGIDIGLPEDFASSYFERIRWAHLAIAELFDEVTGNTGGSSGTS